ncbi:uncharacterized protein LOC128609502 [Ictalurus furcatus]|uniref:uncharacterized protein LOC128609502 n=1 Tax=Ictalurus furcatus TaxID=66913 RepID=UPI002350369D|nr:uncharacterized protein LOC128609502 [Ictalurus furcatus]
MVAGVLVSWFYGPAHDWVVQLIHTGSSALNNVSEFAELFLQEFMQPGQLKSLDLLERGFNGMNMADIPFHLYYECVDQVASAAPFQVPANVVEVAPTCMAEGYWKEAPLRCPTCKKLGLQEAFFCSKMLQEQLDKLLHKKAPAELQPELNVATSEIQLKTHEEVSAPELQKEDNVATSELEPETHEVVSPTELQPEVHVATSEPKLEPEIHEVVSPAELHPRGQRGDLRAAA